MQEQRSVLTRRGQVTVPAEIRRALKLKEGDKLVFSLDDEASGRMTVRPIRSVVERTRGVVTPRRHPENLKAIRAAALETVAEDILAETTSGC